MISQKPIIASLFILISSMSTAFGENTKRYDETFKYAQVSRLGGMCPNNPYTAKANALLDKVVERYDPENKEDKTANKEGYFSLDKYKTFAEAEAKGTGTITKNNVRKYFCNAFLDLHFSEYFEQY